MHSCSPGTTAEKEKACTASRQGDDGRRGCRPMDGNKNPLDGDGSMSEASASQAFSMINDRWTVEKNLLRMILARFVDSESLDLPVVAAAALLHHHRKILPPISSQIVLYLVAENAQ